MAHVTKLISARGKTFEVDKDGRATEVPEEATPKDK